jgi:Tfp pilus assembly protein PilF
MTEKDAERLRLSASRRLKMRVTRSTKRDTSSASAREHLEAGREYLLEGRYNEAIGELSTGRFDRSEADRSPQSFGVAYDKKGFGDRAKESFERAVKMDEDADTLNNLGFSLYQNGNYRAAIDR